MKIECKYNLGDKVYYVSAQREKYGEEFIPTLKSFKISQICIDGDVSYCDDDGYYFEENEISEDAEYAIELFIVNLRKDLIKQKEVLK